MLNFFQSNQHFVNKFTASLLLLKLINQRQSQPLMLKIVISLRFTNIINKS